MSAATGLTSKTNPWSFVRPSPALSSVSSHVSQVPHGVTPPAQLLCVPATLTYSPSRSPLALDLDVGGPAARCGVVGQAVPVRKPERLVTADLVVVHQCQSGRCGEAGRAVGVAGSRFAAVGQGAHAGFGDDPVGEALGERENLLRVGDEGAVSGWPRRCRGRGRGWRAAGDGLDAAQEDDAETCRGATAEDRPPADFAASGPQLRGGVCCARDSVVHGCHGLLSRRRSHPMSECGRDEHRATCG